MILKIHIINTFGTHRIIPLDSTGKAFCELTDTKTLTEEHVRCIQSMGIRFKVEHYDLQCLNLARKIERMNR